MWPEGTLRERKKDQRNEELGIWKDEEIQASLNLNHIKDTKKMEDKEETNRIMETQVGMRQACNPESWQFWEE